MAHSGAFVPHALLGAANFCFSSRTSYKARGTLGGLWLGLLSPVGSVSEAALSSGMKCVPLPLCVALGCFYALVRVVEIKCDCHACAQHTVSGSQGFSASSTNLLLCFYN